MNLFYNAYLQLESDRPAGLSLGAIPWSSVINWCKLHGICDIDDIETVLKYIRAMEKATHESEERKNPSNGK